MGGRGGSSGLASGIAGLSVTLNGNTTDYYFTNKNGENFFQRGLDGMPEPTPQNITASEFKQRVIANGAAVRNISVSERSKKEIKRKTDREASNQMLDRAYVSDSLLVKGSRAARNINRANRRRKK